MSKRYLHCYIRDKEFNHVKDVYVIDIDIPMKSLHEELIPLILDQGKYIAIIVSPVNDSIDLGSLNKEFSDLIEIANNQFFRSKVFDKLKECKKILFDALDITESGLIDNDYYNDIRSAISHIDGILHIDNN